MMDDAPSSSSSSPADPNPIPSEESAFELGLLPSDLVVENVLEQFLSYKDLLRMSSVSSSLRRLCQQDSHRSQKVFDSFLATNRFAPGFPDLLRATMGRQSHVDALSPVHDDYLQRVARFHDRLSGYDVASDEAIQSLLAALPADVRRLYDQLDRCQELIAPTSLDWQPGLHKVDVSDALALELNGLLSPKHAFTAGLICEKDLIEVFVDEGKADLLWDPATLESLIPFRLRLHLVDVLAYAGLPQFDDERRVQDAVALALPLFWALWPVHKSATYESRTSRMVMPPSGDDDDNGGHSRTNWDFLIDLQLLRDENRPKTSLEQFWSLPAVREYFVEGRAALAGGLRRWGQYRVLAGIRYPWRAALYWRGLRLRLSHVGYDALAVHDQIPLKTLFAVGVGAMMFCWQQWPMATYSGAIAGLSGLYYAGVHRDLSM